MFVLYFCGVISEYYQPQIKYKMKMIGFTSRKVFASVIVMLCALIASPRVLGQTLEAYMGLNSEEATLTFY